MTGQEPTGQEPTGQEPTGHAMVLVHAHPDDETINNGATMARYAASGAHVTLVTCTRGERGEVIPAELADLARRPDALGAHREGELTAAMAALGVTDHLFLDEVELGDGARTRYRDSGMAWAPDGRAVAAPDTRPDAFARAELDTAAERLASVLRRVRPRVLITYEPGGGYGHPDHVRTHRVTVLAADLAAGEGPGGPPWVVPKLYWIVVPRPVARAATPDGPLPSIAVPDELVTTAIDGTAFLAAKRAALRCHATQISLDGPSFALSNGVAQPILGTEYYRCVRGVTGGARDGDGRETDLFA